MTMHANSLKARKEEAKQLDKRSYEILAFFRDRCYQSFTDRECAMLLGYDHRSAVQPRISDLINLHHMLYEYGKKKCSVTGKTVRSVAYIMPKVAKPPEQMALL